ncbi:MAG: helix-turn-helix transcriptional regulator [Oscillospiraceae bacterium]|nr:helix-turn-helix transcriptional regulator [Oscillospiraceae bacterium]
MKTLGEMLCEAREAQGMTQEVLANHINMSRSAISNWERDEAQPDFYTLRRISELLHYDFFAFDRNTTANQEQNTRKLRLNMPEKPLIEVISDENAGELREGTLDFRISGSDQRGNAVEFRISAPFSVKSVDD